MPKPKHVSYLRFFGAKNCLVYTGRSEMRKKTCQFLNCLCVVCECVQDTRLFVQYFNNRLIVYLLLRAFLK